MVCAASPSPRRPLFELADIVREHGEAYRRSHALTPDEAAVLRDIERCRTAALGGHLDVCDHCSYTSPSYNSCRNRHCPKCQGLAQAKWIAEREERILPVRHFHVVFTMPAELHALVRFRRTELFQALFACAAQTLLELGRDDRHLGATLGLTAVLHTWTRELRFHPHVHCIVTGGGLSLDGRRWIDARKKYLFPIKVIGALFRGKFLDALRKAHAHGLFAGFDAFEDPEGFDRLMRALAKKDWIVYAKRAFGGAEHVYRYLGRYTHRVGIANSRLIAFDHDAVTFRTKNGKTVTVTPAEFLRRFLLHLLPPGFVKMRHFGLLASGNVNTKLAKARRLLDARVKPALSARAIFDALVIESRRCPVCRVGCLQRHPLSSSEPISFATLFDTS
jgi:Putative transposase/Transposase zinc-binding domain